MVKISKDIAYIGACCGSSAGIRGCENAPDILRRTNKAIHNKFLGSAYVPSDIIDFDEMMELDIFFNELAELTHDAVSQGRFPITLGGDHGIAIGSWAGVVPQGTDFGLIWIDAHLDLHTYDSSDSKNIHGMPTRTLLGDGISSFVDTHYKGAKIKPKNIAYIGIRSFEKAEQECVDALGLKVYMASEVLQRGFGVCLNEVITDFESRGIPYGMSFDVDSLDPVHIGATGTPVNGGLALDSVIEAFENHDMQGLQAFEIVEYNPSLEDITPMDIHIPFKILKCFDSDI